MCLLRFVWRLAVVGVSMSSLSKSSQESESELEDS